MSVGSQFEDVASQVAHECISCGRNPEEVTLVAVSKTVGVDEVGEAIQAGAHDFGENRPEQILEKHDAYPQENWHFIGNVQSRRIKDIVKCASLIHSIYKPEHLPKIEAAAADIDKVVRILIEVNVSGEESKGGARPDDLAALLDASLCLPHVQVCGLMTMAPRGDEQTARACFARLRELRDDMQSRYEVSELNLSELSMGMSEDWRSAIAEGATIVRIGRAVFSADFS